jgi:hypothetical protein
VARRAKSKRRAGATRVVSRVRSSPPARSREIAEVVSVRRGSKMGLAAVELIVLGMLTGVLGARAQGAGSSYIPVNESVVFLRAL